MAKIGLPPLFREDARLLILGSLPGDASLGAGEYYAHPRNHFWRLLNIVTGRDLVSMDYPSKVAAINDCGIALWDVVGSADRTGSLDSGIKNARLNDLRAFVCALPQLGAVAFNGQKAAKFGADAVADLPVDIVILPSSSPAHAIAFETKAEAWGRLVPYVACD